MVTNNSIEVLVLGAGQDVGRSCALLSVNGKRIILDCGAHPGFADDRRFPNFSMIENIQDIDAILITHFHFDHAGALPILTEHFKSNAPIYMTEPTRELARLMLHDMYSTSIARHQHCPFDNNQIETCLAKVSLIQLDQTLNLGVDQQISITAYHAGHTLGAVMFHIQIDQRSILYSGDYCIKSDGHLRAASVPFGIQPDLFISEATYCNIVRKEQRSTREAELVNAILETVKQGGKILIPISAFGRIQTICSILLANHAIKVLQRVPIYVVKGLASRANEVYSKFRDWSLDPIYEEQLRNMKAGETHSKNDQQHENELQQTSFPQFQLFNKREHWDLLHASGPMILFATPGNLSTGLSLDVFREWSPDPKNLVVVPSFIFESTVASNTLGSHLRGQNGNGTQVRCRLINMHYESHSDARGLVRMCRRVQPKNILLVHADKVKIVQFRSKLEKHLGVKCYAPPNNTNTKIRVSDESTSLKSNG